MRGCAWARESLAALEASVRPHTLLLTRHPLLLPCSLLSLVCPDILRPGTREAVFNEHTFVVRRSAASRNALLQAAAASHVPSKHASHSKHFCQSCVHRSPICLPKQPPQACGRNKKEAEQRAAFQALCMIACDAPELGVKPPPVPAVHYNLSSGPSRPTRSTSSTAGSFSDLGMSADDYDTPRGGGSGAAACGSLPGTPAGSVYRSAAPSVTPPSPPSVLQRPPTGLSSRPSDAEVDAMDAAQLRRQLKAALQREAGLRALLGRLRAEIDGALG